MPSQPEGSATGRRWSWSCARRWDGCLPWSPWWPAMAPHGCASMVAMGPKHSVSWLMVWRSWAPWGPWAPVGIRGQAPWKPVVPSDDSQRSTWTTWIWFPATPGHRLPVSNPCLGGGASRQPDRRRPAQGEVGWKGAFALPDRPRESTASGPHPRHRGARRTAARPAAPTPRVRRNSRSRYPENQCQP